jgi:hypothetical protein
VGQGAGAAKEGGLRLGSFGRDLKARSNGPFLSELDNTAYSNFLRPDFFVDSEIGGRLLQYAITKNVALFSGVSVCAAAFDHILPPWLVEGKVRCHTTRAVSVNFEASPESHSSR